MKLFALLAVPAAAFAQTRPDSAPTVLPSVAVTATRTTLEARALPVTVTTFDRKMLIEAGVKQVSDLVRLIPSATVLSTGSFGGQTSLFLRGGEGDYVKVLIDGVPMNAPGGSFDFGQLTIDNIDRVEIVRGPASVLYGSDAVSGVIQIFTRTGTTGTRTNGLIGFASKGGFDAELGMAGKTSGLSWSLAGARHKTDGILAFNNEFKNDVVSGAAKWKGARADAMVTARLTDFTYHYPTDFAGAVNDSNAFVTEERVVLSAEGGFKASRAFELRARWARNRADPKTRDLKDSDTDPDSYVADARVTRNLIEGRMIATIRGAHSLTLAVEKTTDRENSSSHGESGFGPYDDALTAKRDNTGLVGQILGNIGARMTYTAGARRDKDSQFGTFTTGRLGAAYKVNAIVSLRGSFGTAFRAPTFYENFAQGFVVGNPNLTPERARTGELGAQFTTRDKARSGGITLFAQRFRDVIQYVGTAPFGTPNYSNLAAASADGVELEASEQLTSGLSTRVSYTYLRTRVTDAGADEGPSANFVEGDRLLRRPTHLAALVLHQSSANRGAVDVTVTYTGKRDDRDFAAFPARPIVMKAFTRVDIATSRPLDDFGPLHSPSLIARVENVLNTSYEQVYGFKSPGRTYFVGLRIGQ